MLKLYPDWPAPSQVTAFTTHRQQGNIALHVDDDPLLVTANRQQLRRIAGLPQEPEWLEQTHSTRCVIVEEETSRQADAAITRTPNTVLSIMTADCLPILLCNKAGTEIAAIHAGWRGLLGGIVENTLAKMQSAPQDIFVWLGPAICQKCYEVGAEVREQYLDVYAFAEHCFIPKTGNKYLADIPQIAENLLHHLSVSNVFKSNICTFEGENECYSYRREQQTGRMASLIWFQE